MENSVLVGRKVKSIFGAYGTMTRRGGRVMQVPILAWLVCLPWTSPTWPTFLVSLFCFFSPHLPFQLTINSFLCSSAISLSCTFFLNRYLTQKLFYSLLYSQQICFKKKKNTCQKTLLKNMFFIFKVDNGEFYNPRKLEKQFSGGWDSKDLVQNTNN